MDKVYFLRDSKKTGQAVKKLFDDFYPTGNEILIKMHFGEPGNKRTFKTSDVEPIISVLKDFKLKPIFIDTLVAYNSPRGTVEGHQKVAQEKGYDRLAPVIISDKFIEVSAKDFIVQVCKELAEAKNVLVVSHVKGHSCAGFGGAIKNLAMGGVTKKSKSAQHNLCQPKFVSGCDGCGICAKLCPAGAIKMVDNKAELDNSLCWGCSICQIECPNKHLAPEVAYFDDLLGQAAAAVIKNLPEKTFYINFLQNIVKLCDCASNPGEPISEDIGILFSQNPIAIDKASIDLINQKNNRNLFKEIEHKDPFLQIEYASKYTGKSKDYELILV